MASWGSQPLQVVIKVRGGGAPGWGWESRVPRREKQLLMLRPTHSPGVWGAQELGALFLCSPQGQRISSWGAPGAGGHVGAVGKAPRICRNSLSSPWG